MTFDFATEWTDCETAWASSSGSQPRLSEASPPAFAVPIRPTAIELAKLLRELFHEGSLTWQQLRSLSGQPEIGPLLIEALTAAPRLRRPPLAAE